ncbi:HIT family protein [Methanobrevibacter sp. OttesenSCG-928-K11]|nr:HIT family protein [Methanobrevibacter sp. OttesenSCG-928-K11]
MKINKTIEKSGFYGDLIFSSEFWEFYLAPNQTYLGTGVLLLKRHCEGLRYIEKEEWEDFNELVKAIELGLLDTFNITLFNWASASNLTFRDNNDNPKPQVHWHIHPRYENPVTFDGVKFVDENFGYMPTTESKDISDDIRHKIIETIRTHF